MDWIKYTEALEVPGESGRRGMTRLARAYAAKVAQERAKRLIVADTAPERVFAAVAAGMTEGAMVYLFNPAWGEAEQNAALRQVGEAFLLPSGRTVTAESPDRASEWFDSIGPALAIPTGGTGGEIRFAVHNEKTLAAAVRGFAAFFELDSVSAVSLLPPHHVSGFMPWLRAAFTGGTVALAPPEKPWKSTAAPHGFLSVAPTQLARWCDDPQAAAWLARFDRVLVGGGPVWPDVLEKALQAGVRPVVSYGMTETAAMAAARVVKPDEEETGLFLLPHIEGGIVDPNGAVSREPGLEGPVAFEAESLFLGYAAGKQRQPGFWQTDDIGALDHSGQLHLRGRADDAAISGGEKIFPSEVEAALRESGLVEEVHVTKTADPEWGEKLVAYYVPRRDADDSKLANAVKSRLTPHKVPKVWVRVSSLDRASTGKIDPRRLPASQ